MLITSTTSTRKRQTAAIVATLLALALAIPSFADGDKKKKKKGNATSEQKVEPKVQIDTSKLVWPSPPSIPRVRYLNYFAGMKIDYTAQTKKKKQGWMDRLAGAKQESDTINPKDFPFQLLGPYGIAIDSKGLVYVADQKVGAIFIFNTDSRDVQLIRNGYEAHFGLINGLAIDDDDRLFVSDGKMHRVLILDSKREVAGQISEGLVDPVGLAIDRQNRFLYVVDTQQDQVLVFDADTLKLLRRIGTGGKNHWLTTPGDFGAPSNVALDKEGNVYVTDTMNNRVEIFDADGNFLSEFGKHGDGPGYLARPKGIAVDSDGHIWVADSYQDRVQVFNREGQLLTYLGGHGHYPGQFEALIGIAIDKENHVFTTEQYPGRMQMFRYVTDAEAAAEKSRREAELEKAAPKTGESSPQKGGGQTKEQSSELPQAEREFRPVESGRNSDKHGRLADPRLVEVDLSNPVEVTFGNTYRRF
ncbi:MAG TPA: SMP-30/gluconolactonase/LRE family protein [Candidatus Angelobacter sp.]|nr:SMP-30/gluconolactonase/LRE family protein [Candidatus Angelobacter sp.]